MKCLTVSSCGGFDLKTGGLLIGYFELFAAILVSISLIRHPFEGDHWYLKSFWIFLFLSAVFSWLEGIYEKKLEYMEWNIFFSICCFVLSVVFIITFWFFYMVDLKNDPDQRIKHLRDVFSRHKIEKIIASSTLSFWLIFYLFCGIQWYFIAVKYSLYKAMKAGRLQPTSNVELGERGEGIC